jgi:hypothetical protein
VSFTEAGQRAQTCRCIYRYGAPRLEEQLTESAAFKPKATKAAAP